MGSDVPRVSEWNEQERNLEDLKSVLPALLERSRERHWTLTKYMDPYGDTVFNQLRIDRVLEEFRALREYCRSEDEEAWLREAITLIEGSRNVHTWVKSVRD